MHFIITDEPKYKKCLILKYLTNLYLPILFKRRYEITEILYILLFFQ